MRLRDLPSGAPTTCAQPLWTPPRTLLKGLRILALGALGPQERIMPSPTHIPVGATGLELAATITQTMLPLGAMRDPIPPSARFGAYLGLSSTSSTCRPNSYLTAARQPAHRDTATLLRRRSRGTGGSSRPPSTGGEPATPPKRAVSLSGGRHPSWWTSRPDSHVTLIDPGPASVPHSPNPGVTEEAQPRRRQEGPKSRRPAPPPSRRRSS